MILKYELVLTFFSCNFEFGCDYDFLAPSLTNYTCQYYICSNNLLQQTVFWTE